MPDDQDYADLARLLASPESWSERDAALAHSLLRSQEQAAESVHPQDRRRRADMHAVADSIRAAVAAHERRSE